MKLQYNPRDWFWLADDGRIFSSKAEAIVTAENADYVSFLDEAEPTRWPTDAAGLQTEDALQDVLRPFNIYVNLAFYAAHKRWEIEVGGFEVNGYRFATDREDSQPKLIASVVQATLNPQMTFPWKLQDGSFAPTMNAADMIGVATAIAAFVNGLFAKEGRIVAGILSGAIKTRAQIDTALA